MMYRTIEDSASVNGHFDRDHRQFKKVVIVYASRIGIDTLISDTLPKSIKIIHVTIIQSSGIFKGRTELTNSQKTSSSNSTPFYNPHFRGITMFQSSLQSTLISILLVLPLCSTTPLQLRNPGKQFEWDPSCDAPDPMDEDRTKLLSVSEAFQGAMDLVDNLTPTLQQTYDIYTKAGGNPKPEDKKKVGRDDPAYVQFFKNDPTKAQLDYIVNVFKNMRSVEDNPGTGKRPAAPDGGILIRCKETKICKEKPVAGEHKDSHVHAYGIPAEEKTYR